MWFSPTEDIDNRSTWQSLTCQLVSTGMLGICTGMQDTVNHRRPIRRRAGTRMPGIDTGMSDTVDSHRHKCPITYTGM